MPTWLLRMVSRFAWNASPSGTLTGRSPYQLSSTTSPSWASSSSDRASPASVALACTTRSQSPTASSGAANPTPSAAATDAREGSGSTSSTRTPGIPASTAATLHPTIPAPTTAIRSPTSGAASHRALTAVSTVPASTARAPGTASGTGVTAVAGTTKRVWCGWRQNTVRPSSGPDSTTPTAR